jgi:hypothetical protein
MRDVIAIGDVHGDGDRLLHALSRLGLASGTPSEPRWTGGTVSLVLLGDVLDGKERTEHPYRSSIGDLDLVTYLSKLRALARHSGGNVTCLLGNHELMNLRGDYSYVHARDLPARTGSLQGAVGRQLRTWKRAHVENHTLFCHAGVHASCAPDVRDARDIQKVPDQLILEHRQYMPDAAPKPRDVHALAGMLERLNCDRMVIGHNSVAEPTSVWDGKVVLADACLSRAYGEAGAVHVLCIRPFKDSRWETVTIRM